MVFFPVFSYTVSSRVSFFICPNLLCIYYIMCVMIRRRLCMKKTDVMCEN